MLIADIRGKLTLSELVSEDFLTSAVFSAFRYLGEHWLDRFINHAINIKKEKLNVKLQNPRYEFWPWFSNETKFGNGAEPDVIIYSEEIALIIEAKNYAGKSGEGVIFDKSEKSTAEDKSKVIIDQLGREYFVGLNRILNSKHIQNNKQFSIKNFYLIFLTRHSFFPNNEIEETLKSISIIRRGEHQNAANRIYWLNWQKAVPIFKEIVTLKPKNSFQHRISKELIEFLERRDLSVFSGFKFLDYYKFSSRKFEIVKKADVLFYSKIFRMYWNYLDRFKTFLKNQVDNIFYSECKLPYWSFLKIDFVLQFNKKIFYFEEG